MKKGWIFALALLCLVVCGCRERDCTLSYYLDGELYRTVQVQEGTLSPDELVPPPAKEGCTFLGWSLEEGGKPEKSVKVEEDLSLHAVFSSPSEPGPSGPSEETFTVTFVAEWEGKVVTLSTQKVKKGERAVPPTASDVPQHEGHSFVGWDGDVEAPIGGRTQFKAVYQRNSYTLAREVLGKRTEEKVLFGGKVSLGEPQLDDAYLFERWEGAESGEFVMPAHDVVLTACVKVNFLDAALAGGPFVYGGENRLAVTGLPEAEGLSYAFEWTGVQGEGDAALLPGAGEYSVQVTVRATFPGGSDSAELKREVTVSKKPLSASLTVPQAAYGETPGPVLSVSGFAEGESMEDVGEVRYEYCTPSGEGAVFPYPAGSYTVRAIFPELRNYTLPAVLSQFTVVKRELTVRASVDDFVYGGAPSPEIAFDGFFGEENREVFSSESYSYTKGGEPFAGERFSAGEYTLTYRAEAQNYKIPETVCTFSVQKRPVTVSVTVEKETLVYGEAPRASAACSPLAFDDTPALFGALSPVFLKGEEETEEFHVGAYTATVRPAPNENYEIAVQPASFTVTKKPLAVSAKGEDIVYGEEAKTSVLYDGFVSGEEGLGTARAVCYRGEQSAEGRLPAGEYTVRAEGLAELPDYEVSLSEGNFTVSPKPLKASLALPSLVFGQELRLTPVVEGLIEGDEAPVLVIVCKKGEEETELEKRGDAYVSEGYLAAGTYAVEMNFSPAPENYAPSYTCSGTLTIEKKPLPIASEVSQNRNRRWTYSPEAGAPFETEGELVLDRTDAGIYTADSEETLAGNGFRWSVPLRITHGGKEVTGSFKPVYDLHVTLNNSRFSVSVPKNTSFVYDGTEHIFGVEVTPEEGDDLRPEISYRVDGGGWSAQPPRIKNAGTYAVSCTVSAQNYETESRSFSVTVERAEYTLSGTLGDLNEDYDGEGHGTEPSLSGVNGEDVSSRLKISIGYVPFLGEETAVVGWGNIVNAGVYSISLTASGDENYHDITDRKFTITVARIPLAVSAEDQRYTYAPGVSFGKGVTVLNIIAGNDYTVQYSYELGGSHTGEEIPLFTEATEGVTVFYTVPAGRNYLENSGSYTVTVDKAAGVLDLSGIKKDYVYTGQLQTVTGASSNNGEDEKIDYENNTFTTVAEGNALSVKVILREGKNYTGAEETVTGFTVDKMTLSALPHGVETPVIAEQVNKIGKGLGDVSLPEHFRWAREQALSLGGHGYDAFYNEDSANCNDFALEIVFTTRKEVLTATFLGGEGDFEKGAGAAKYSLASFTLAGEDREIAEGAEEYGYAELKTEGNVDYAVGGTYPVQCTLTVRENDYFTVENKEGRVFFKLRSAEYGGALYTVEDALALADSGTVTVKYDTAFSDGCYEGELAVKKGVTLLVPYGENDTGDTSQKSKQAFSPVAGKGYVTLSLPKGELNVYGTLVIGGLRSSDSGKTSMIVGENYGNLEIGRGGLVRVKEGGVFESMGFTYGEGEVEAESGSSVFEPFAMAGWKGGSISAAVRNEVFPLNQYALSSLVCRTTFAAGAEYSVRASVTATLSLLGGEQNLDLAVRFLGSGEDNFFQLRSGEMTKYVNEENGKVCFELAGGLDFSNLALSLGGSLNFSTAGLQVPVPGNFSIVLKRGSSATVPDGVALKLLPGASVTVEEGASVEIAAGGKLLAYGEGTTFDGVSAFCDGGNHFSYPHAALSDGYRKPVKSFGYTAASPAVLSIEGSLTVVSGGVFAAEVVGGGEREIDPAAVLTASVQEDNTPAITSTMGKMQALYGKGGVYFTAHFSANVAPAAGRRRLWRS